MQKLRHVRGEAVAGSVVSCGKPITAMLWTLPELQFTGESEYSYLDLGCLECFGVFRRGSGCPEK